MSTLRRNPTRITDELRRAVGLAVCCGLFAVFCAAGWQDIFRSMPEEAERAYQSEDYERALRLYQESQIRNPDSDTLAYNLGNTLYQLGRYDEAARQYERVLEGDSTSLGPRTVYNMGNTLFRMGRGGGNPQMLEQALEAYKQAVMADPEDLDAKYNYELTRKLIQQQQQQQQQQQGGQDEKQQQKQDEQKGEDNQQQQEQQQQEQDQPQEEQRQQQQAQPQDQQQPDQQPQPQPGELSREEAERILQALQQMEKEAREQEEREQRKQAGGKTGRDW